MDIKILAHAACELRINVSEYEELNVLIASVTAAVSKWQTVQRNIEFLEE